MDLQYVYLFNLLVLFTGIGVLHSYFGFDGARPGKCNSFQDNFFTQTDTSVTGVLFRNQKVPCLKNFNIQDGRGPQKLLFAKEVKFFTLQVWKEGRLQ